MRRCKVAFALLPLLAACAADPDGPPLAVSFEWASVGTRQQCSPAITVRGAPPGTARYAVRLMDINMSSFPHGGGTLDRPADDVIPVCGLTDGYSAPAPPGTHRYRFTVRALDASGRVIAVGFAERLYPP